MPIDSRDKKYQEELVVPPAIFLGFRRPVRQFGLPRLPIIQQAQAPNRPVRRKG